MWWWGKGRQPQSTEEPVPEIPPAPPPTLYRVMYPGDLAALKALHSKLFAFDYDMGSFIAALKSDRFISLAAYPQSSSGTLLGCVITTMAPVGAFLAMESDNRTDANPATASSQTVSNSSDGNGISPNGSASSSSNVGSSSTSSSTSTSSSSSSNSTQLSVISSANAGAQGTIGPAGQLKADTGTGGRSQEAENGSASQAGSAVDVTETENAGAVGRDLDAANSEGGEFDNTTGCNHSKVGETISDVPAEPERAHAQHIAQQQQAQLEATQQQQAQNGAAQNKATPQQQAQQEHGQSEEAEHQEAQQQQAQQQQQQAHQQQQQAHQQQAQQQQAHQQQAQQQQAHPEAPEEQKQARPHPGLLRWLSEREDERGLYICWLGVAPAAQGRGIGATLLNHALTCAESVGALHVLLHVQVDNYQAQRFYERHGFRALCLVPNFYELADSKRTLVDALLMHRKVIDDGYQELNSGSSDQDAGMSGEESLAQDAGMSGEEAFHIPKTCSVTASVRQGSQTATSGDDGIRVRDIGIMVGDDGIIVRDDKTIVGNDTDDNIMVGNAGVNMSSSGDLAGWDEFRGMRGGGNPWMYATVAHSVQHQTYFGSNARPAVVHPGHGATKLRSSRRRGCADRLDMTQGSAHVWRTLRSCVPTSYSHTHTANGHTRTADSHNRTADGHTRTADSHNRTADNHNRTECAHNRTICGYTRTADGHSRTAFGRTRTAGGHSRTASASSRSMLRASSSTQQPGLSWGSQVERRDCGAGTSTLRSLRHCDVLNSAVKDGRFGKAEGHRGVLGYRRQCTMGCAFKKRL